MASKAVEFIVSGEVQAVGYRGYIAKIARKLKLVGFVENLEDGTVRIWCKGENTIIDKFRKSINVKNPPEASLIEVEDIVENQLKEEQVIETLFKQKPGELAVEMMQGFSTGMKYMNGLKTEMGGLKTEMGGLKTEMGGLKTEMGGLKTEMHEFRMETKSNFDRLDTKYDRISIAIEKISKTNEILVKILQEKGRSS